MAVFCEVSGTFFKIVMPAEELLVLTPHCTRRPVARYNRAGQDALYLTQNEESARAALSRYVREGTRHRVLARYEVSCCQVLDLRTAEAGDLKRQASQKWDDVLAAGKIPPSWQVADWAREQGYDGLIDPSRQTPQFWHLVLFRWNVAGAPSVKLIGEPKPVILDL